MEKERSIDISNPNNVVIYNDPTIVNSVSSPTDREALPKLSVIRVRRPVLNFKETVAYNNVKAEVLRSSHLILHCHGLPGCGQTQILRKLASEFPYADSSKECVKWHIECENHANNLEAELSELLDVIHKSGLTEPDVNFEYIKKDLKRNIAGSFVSLLASLEIPVLIIFQYVSLESHTLFIDFLRSFDSCKSFANADNMHAYFSLRKGKAEIDEEALNMTTYQNVRIKPFTSEEGVAFLLEDKRGDAEQAKSALKIHERFSGSPLGMRAAKAFCKTSMIDYSDYLECIEVDSEEVIHEGEVESLRHVYGEKGSHIFQAITLPFRPKADGAANDKRSQLLWNVVCCLAYLHHTCIPRAVIQRFCQHFRERSPAPDVARRTSALNNKLDSGFILTRLVESELCTKEANDDVTFHEVVLHAFRIGSQLTRGDDFSPLKTAVLVMCSLVTKDVRKVEANATMHKMMPHLHKLISHTERGLEQTDEAICERAAPPHLLPMLQGYLHEVYGSLKLNYNHSVWRECEGHLVTALDRTIAAVNELSGSNLRLEMLQTAGDKTEELCEEIYLACCRAGCIATQVFVDAFERIVFHPLNREEIEFLQKLANDGKVFSELKQQLKEGWFIDSSCIARLRDCGLFLESPKHERTFFVERFASILHSLSRVKLFDETEAKCDASTGSYERYFNMSKLSLALSARCKHEHSVPIIFQYLAVVAGTVPLSLKRAKGKDFGANDSSLIDARDMCKAVLDEENAQSYFFEHGLPKEVHGSEYSNVYLLRQLVRLNARMMRFMEGNQQLMEECDRACAKLLDLALNSVSTLSIANCFVYCGKYYAARGDFGRALRSFTQFFVAAESKPQSHKLVSWATYNYARVVLTGRLEGMYESALAKCKDLLESKKPTAPNLKCKIIKLFKELSTLSISASSGSAWE